MQGGSAGQALSLRRLRLPVPIVSDSVPAGFDGERIDRFAAALIGRSRSAVAELARSGAINVDGRPVASPSLRLRAGQLVSVEAPESAPVRLVPDPDVAFGVIYADEHIAVVDKPPGLVVHPGPGHPDGTLVNGLLALFPEMAEVGQPERPGIVHRLDKDTSGLLVTARSPAAYEALVKAMTARLPERRYSALVWGRLDSDEGTIDAPVARSLRNPTRMAVAERGRPAVTHYRVERRFDRPCALSLLECRLQTGRTHQIRVHLRAVGHPVVGDRSYDGARPGPDPQRPFLHACRLRFRHPLTDEAVDCTVPLPPDLAAVLAECGTGTRA